jgi:hypothetical protein
LVVMLWGRLPSAAQNACHDSTASECRTSSSDMIPMPVGLLLLLLLLLWCCMCEHFDRTW